MIQCKYRKAALEIYKGDGMRKIKIITLTQRSLYLAVYFLVIAFADLISMPRKIGWIPLLTYIAIFVFHKYFIEENIYYKEKYKFKHFLIPLIPLSLAGGTAWYIPIMEEWVVNLFHSWGY